MAARQDHGLRGRIRDLPAMSMMERPPTFDELRELLGQKIGISDWAHISQERIDQFAECTGDRNWIHVDQEKARRRSPLRTTIAHGYLTLSMVGSLTQEMNIVPENTQAIINLGLDKVRFIAPVRSGARIRVHVTFKSMIDEGPGKYRLTSDTMVEIEGEETPALVAETTVVLYEKRVRKVEAPA
jgi:acyl dehydratase